MKKYYKHSVKEGKTEFVGLYIDDNTHDINDLLASGVDGNLIELAYGVSKVYKGKNNDGPDVYVRADGRKYSERNSVSVLAKLIGSSLINNLTTAVLQFEYESKKVDVLITNRVGSKVVKIYIP